MNKVNETGIKDECTEKLEEGTADILQDTPKSSKKAKKVEVPKEFIKCCKCGKGETYLITRKVGELIVPVGVLGKVTLRAIRPAGKFNPLSGKVHKNKPTEYICNECGNFK